MRLRALKALLAALGVILLVHFWWPRREQIASGGNDFLPMYAAARLVGTRDLYDAYRNKQVEQESAGMFAPAIQFNRLPYYALFLWPLGRLPYKTAYAVWQALSLLALVGFIALWPVPKRFNLLMACCWSLPVAGTFANGQDTLFLLLWVSLAIWFWQRRPLVAGLILSLCAAKFHLFILLPILIAAQRAWRVGAGLLAGGTVLLGLSFIGGGVDWPARYYWAARSPSVGENTMPNLQAIFAGAQYGIVLQLALAVPVATAVWLVTRRSNLQYGIAAVLIGGLLVSVHAYQQDCVLLIPALFGVIYHEASWLRHLGLVLLAPPWYQFLQSGPPLAATLPIGLLVLLCGMAFKTWRAQRLSCVKPTAHL